MAYTGICAANADAEVRAETGRGKEDREEAGEVVTVPLTQGQVAIIDGADAERVSRHRWCAMQNVRGDWYAYRSKRLGGGRRKTVYMHRFILDAPIGELVDHRNGNGLDNRRTNLRLATNAQNLRNRGRTRANRCGYKGVSRTRHGKWGARINVNGKYVGLGHSFCTPEDAARAYDAGARRYHGRFACVNFPDEERGE